MAHDPSIQSQLDPNQLGMLMDPNSVNMLTSLMAGIQNIQLDDELEEEDVVILSNDAIPQEIGIKVGTKKGNKLFNSIPDSKLKEMQDDDDIIDFFLSNQEQFQVCEFLKKGGCRFGDKCKFYHPKDMAKKSVNGSDMILDDECCICLDKVIASGKQFGVLDGCDHTFCLDCIRGWRSTYDKRASKHHYRTCPICRRNSYVVVPSSKMIKNGPEKTDLIEEYKEVLKSIPCKHFNSGKGICPFMNSCFYAHSMPDGTPYLYPWKDNKLNEFGEWEDDTETTLADRIGSI